MPVSSTIRIGKDEVDLGKPCEVVAALKKMRILLASGGVRETVRIDGEEVTFQSASDKRLSSLIKQYEAGCAAASGTRHRSRFAKRVRFGG